MEFRLTANDYKIMKAIAEHRIITIAQTAALFNRNKQALSRRLRDLQRQGFLVMTQQEYGRGRGRPESLVSLGLRGVDTLKKNEILGADVPDDMVIADNIHCIDHQLLLNWFSIHLNHIQTVLPRLIRVCRITIKLLFYKTIGFVYTLSGERNSSLIV